MRLGGDGSAPASHELLPAALASCISTTLVMYARPKEWPLERVAVDVELRRAFEAGFGLEARPGVLRGEHMFA